MDVRRQASYFMHSTVYDEHSDSMVSFRAHNAWFICYRFIFFQRMQHERASCTMGSIAAASLVSRNSFFLNFIFLSYQPLSQSNICHHDDLILWAAATMAREVLEKSKAVALLEMWHKYENFRFLYILLIIHKMLLIRANITFSSPCRCASTRIN